MARDDLAAVRRWVAVLAADSTMSDSGTAAGGWATSVRIPDPAADSGAVSGTATLRGMSPVGSLLLLLLPLPLLRRCVEPEGGGGCTEWLDVDDPCWWTFNSGGSETISGIEATEEVPSWIGRGVTEVVSAVLSRRVANRLFEMDEVLKEWSFRACV